MANPTSQQKEKKSLLDGITEESLRAASTDAQAGDENEADKPENNPEQPEYDKEGNVVKPRTINDRTVEDKDVSGFFDFLRHYKPMDMDLAEQDFAEFFLVYKKSPEEARKTMERHYQQWVGKLKKEGPGTWSRIREALKLPHYKLMLGQFPSAFAFERVYGALLDKRVQELASANLNARDRIKLLNHALEVKDLFESRAILLSLGHTSDFSEEILEKYYDAFADEQEGIIRHSSGPIKESDPGLNKYDSVTDFAGDKVITKLGKLGTTEDMWFEVKLRRETHVRGKRPDVWHAGRRDYLWDFHGNKIIGVCWKSKEWIAEETNFDGRLSPGRKGDTASETFQYNMLGGDKEKAYGMKLLLQKKLGELKSELADPVKRINYEKKVSELDEKISVLKEMRDNLGNDIDKTPYDSKIKELEYEKEKLVQKRLDDEQQARLIKERLERGIDANGIKSLLLDSTSDDYVEWEDAHGRHRVSEYDVAYNRGTFIYAMARTDRDVRVLTNAEHVTAEERLSQAQFFSDDYREELFWRTKHYSFGIHDTKGNYDEARDGARNIWRATHSGVEGGASFSQGANNYFMSKEKIEGARRIITDYEDPATHYSYQVWLDYNVPDPPHEFLHQFKNYDPHFKTEWDRKRQEAFNAGHFYAEAVPTADLPPLGRLAEALMKPDSSSAITVLSNRRSGTLEQEFSKATKELNVFREAIPKEPGTFEGIPPANMKKIIDIFMAGIKSNQDNSYRISYEDISSSEIIVTPAEELKIREGISKINQKLADVEKAFENMGVIKDRYEQAIQDIIDQQSKENIDASFFARNLDLDAKKIKKLKDELPSDLKDTLKSDQRQEIEKLLGEAPADMTVMDAWKKLNDLQTLKNLAYKVLVPKEEEDRPARQQPPRPGGGAEEE